MRLRPQYGDIKFREARQVRDWTVNERLSNYFLPSSREMRLLGMAEGGPEYYPTLLLSRRRSVVD